MSENGIGSQPVYRRILLKLSGEAFANKTAGSIDTDTVYLIANQIKEVAQAGVQIACVVGGGNIWRGLAASARRYGPRHGRLHGHARDRDQCTRPARCARETSASRRACRPRSPMSQVAEPYIRRRAIRHLEKGRVVIFAAGTGNPYFTTDTTAALRALEIGAEAILKATQVDGVYNADPKKDPAAVRFERLEYLEVLQLGLEVLDNTALTLCMDNGLPIVVFELMRQGNIKRVIWGEPIGTYVGRAKDNVTPAVP